ncbi:RNA polymerase sigma-70 factor [Mariniphaga sediminis]|uniref:RNA polymerase sigma factor n=1 Tax=Mariniphaga sediminis TaxID=1628158 RepID=A0A399DAP4_9BACT|nr:RNA polymerase sigma-70 factor [Mariniphaga sediminis]RIH67201.1 RNA polymerase sigma-70 factor [Mariniphaga sediminis]
MYPLKGEKSNTDLLKLLKKGNIRAFDAIYEKYSKRLYVFVFRYIKQKTDAEEIVQEVFLKIWESREKIDLYSSFDSFLFTIAYNNTISLLRKRVNEKKYLEHLKHKQQVSDNEGIIAEMHFKEIEKRVKSLLEQLTPRQKEIFYLSREEGLTHEEIAKKLNISANTVKNHLVATLAFLKSGISGNMLAIMLFVHLFL